MLKIWNMWMQMISVHCHFTLLFPQPCHIYVVAIQEKFNFWQVPLSIKKLTYSIPGYENTSNSSNNLWWPVNKTFIYTFNISMVTSQTHRRVWMFLVAALLELRASQARSEWGQGQVQPQLQGFSDFLGFLSGTLLSQANLASTRPNGHNANERQFVLPDRQSICWLT